jgi:hypothetical protein
MGRGRRTVAWALAFLAGAMLLAGGTLSALLRSRRAADWGAAAILHPLRRPLTLSPSLQFETIAFTSGRERLEGWRFAGEGPSRGLVVYLHGIADNRQSGLGAAARLVPRGYDFYVFDGRAHGRSTGEACSYGYRERHDVSRALDALAAEQAILIGHSLGAAVALQAAAVDRRVRAVVAVSSFSDLPTIVRERARWLRLPDPLVDAALRRASELGGFPAEQASPLAVAPRVEAPVLLLHGGDDRKTPADHSRRISAALRCPHRLVVLPGVGHDEILGEREAWREIDAFLDEVARDGAGVSRCGRPSQARDRSKADGRAQRGATSKDTSNRTTRPAAAGSTTSSKPR